MKKYIVENGIQYELKGEQYYPTFRLPEQKPIGRFGRQHLAFLKEYRKSTYATLLTSGELNEHLAEIDRDATEMYRSLISQFVKSEGITESLKATDPIKWVQAMNNIAQRVDEIIQSELLFV